MRKEGSFSQSRGREGGVPMRHSSTLRCQTGKNEDSKGKFSLQEAGEEAWVQHCDQEEDSRRAVTIMS